MATINSTKPVFTERIPGKIHRLTMTLHFEHGLAVGDGTFGNKMILARNGKGQLVLRGTALAGVLRSAWREYYDDAQKYFGDSSGDQGVSSLLIVPDCIIETKDDKEIYEFRRTHHLRCRHRGSVLDGGLYSLEMVPPKTEITLTLWFNETDPNQCGLDFFRKIAGLFKQGLIFGGNSNRGVGLATGEDFKYEAYDFGRSEKKDEYSRYLKDHYQWRTGGKLSEEAKADTSFAPEPPALWREKNLEVKFSLTLPRGQDLLVSQENSESGDAEPHRVTGTDGKDYWLIPGSSLHGLFRDWVNRLAARDDKNIADSCENFEANPDRNGEDIAWLFMKDKEQNKYKGSSNDLQADYPVDNLFGSLYRAGRVHISDAIAPVSNSDKTTDELALKANTGVQKRVHVAIDAISGGAIEHLLFENYVLVADEQKPVFHFTMIVRDIQECEADWLAKTLKAIDIGLLRIGSSKSSGRLALAYPAKAEGRFAEKFKNIHPLENSR